MITCHAVIGGFTQKRNRWHGMLKLHEQMLHEFGNGLKTRIWFQRWCDDWEGIAEHVWLIGEKYDEPIQVAIYAYSWGAGWGAMQLAKALDTSNIKVRVMVLSDPVFRHPLVSMRWLAMVPWSKIHVPVNVKEVYSYFQRQNRPNGHELVGKLSTDIHDPIQLNYIHQKMDDAAEFHGMCLKQAREIERDRE